MRTLQVFIDYWFESVILPDAAKTLVMTENQRTILIIDDCPEDRETYRRYLLQDSRYTYTILEGRVWGNGLELCRLVKPDAILLDFLPQILMGWSFWKS